MLDSQHLAVYGQRAIGLVCEHAFGQDLAKLHAFLVEAVEVPEETLEHDLVLEMREERSHGFRREPIADDDARRPSAIKLLVQVIVVLAASEGDDLRSHVGTQLLLAVAALDQDVRLALVLPEPDELQGHDILALVEQLVERVLAVSPRFAE